jgi:hypothetical protein
MARIGLRSFISRQLPNPAAPFPEMYSKSNPAAKNTLQFAFYSL